MENLLPLQTFRLICLIPNSQKKRPYYGLWNIFIGYLIPIRHIFGIAIIQNIDKWI